MRSKVLRSWLEVHLTKFKDSNGSIFWHLSDDGNTVEPFLDYILFLKRSHAPKTIEGHAYKLATWFKFLKEISTEYLDASDQSIEIYRKHLYSRNSSDPRTRMRTINSSLESVYKFYYFLNSTSHPHLNLIGTTGSNITSSLGSAEVTKYTEKYPYCFRNIGENSRHATKWSPTDRHKAEIFKFFIENHTQEVATRNNLIIDIADTVAFRRGSLISLKTHQFPPIDDDKLELEFIQISPYTQKFNYKKYFDCPTELYCRIRAYIENARFDIVRATDSKSDSLFLNTKTGKPITESGISGIMSRARRSLKWPYNGGLHSWRRKSAQDFLEREIEERLLLGLDTSYEALALALAEFLGHENLESQRPYINKCMKKLIQKKVTTLKSQIFELATENEMLREQLRIRNKQ